MIFFYFCLFFPRIQAMMQIQKHQETVSVLEDIEEFVGDGSEKLEGSEINGKNAQEEKVTVVTVKQKQFQ